MSNFLIFIKEDNMKRKKISVWVICLGLLLITACSKEAKVTYKNDTGYLFQVKRPTSDSWTNLSAITSKTYTVEWDKGDTKDVVLGHKHSNGGPICNLENKKLKNGSILIPKEIYRKSSKISLPLSLYID